ncbi:uncharacterized protein (DUF2141 family) [Palleronia aestuarii]|uniref:Uncharacterized protein (DUF2141 family) n=1 Tax=Palleronia aestuarii TaxID=568105 RepID=A0A2W7Q5P8_9RHOB|nr:DUF2141 domain-containing protein [Palleronia aestuarii]PZX17049.1 uncharacterized protein (DUF2141 family) [Palleronia aestuarii]
MEKRPFPVLRERGQSLLLALFATLCLGSAASAADVSVLVDGLRGEVGLLRVAICTQGDFLTAKCAITASAPAPQGKVRLSDVPAGQYAIQAYHDENSNGRLDRNMLGRPMEGMAFSRDAPMRFGPPRYADAVVTIPETGGTTTMTMRYFR